jgi:hypothetical protein
VSSNPDERRPGSRAVLFFAGTERLQTLGSPPLDVDAQGAEHGRERFDEARPSAPFVPQRKKVLDRIGPCSSQKGKNDNHRPVKLQYDFAVAFRVIAILQGRLKPSHNGAIGLPFIMTARVYRSVEKLTRAGTMSD